MRHKPIVIVALLAIIADISGVCLVVSATTDSSEVVPVVAYEEAPIPVANVASYSDIFGHTDDNPPLPPAKKVTTIQEDGSVIEEDAPTVLEYNSATKPGYMNNCYFLGDSRLVAMVSYGFVSDANVLAKIGVSHTSVESTTFMQNSGKQYTVKQYLQATNPPVVYVCYGVNGMKGISEEKYEKSYKELVEHIMEWAPNSKIVLMSIWPVDDYGRYQGNVKNEWINTYNDFLLALAEYEGLFYLDVSSVLKGSDGQIKPEFDGGDGLHYKASAYNTILDYIIHHPVKGISDDGEFKVKYVPPSGEFKKIMTEKPKLPDNVTIQEPEPTPEEPQIIPSPSVTPSPSVVAEPKPSNVDLITPSVSPSPSIEVISEPTEIPTPESTPEPTQETEPTAEPTPELSPSPTPIPDSGATPTPDGAGGLDDNVEQGA